MPSGLALRGVTKRYEPDTVALRDVSLDLPSGSVLVLVGPTGSGKTTLLRLIAGLDDPTEGEIAFNGKDLTGRSPKDRDVAMVFQHPMLFINQSVASNIGYGLRLRNYPQTEIARRVDDVARRLQIAQLLTRPARQLSGGERQRVALARALVRKPAIFLFDEPLTYLDLNTREQLRELLQQLRSAVPTAVFIYVTHDQEEAMNLGQLVGVMRSGRILQLGEPEDLYRRPTCMGVARFFGQHPINFLPGRIVMHEGSAQFDAGGGFRLMIDRDRQAEAAARAGAEVVAGARPEDVYDKLFITEAPRGSTVTAVCLWRDLLLPDALLIVECGSRRFRARVPAYARPEPQRDIEIAFDVPKVMFFDPKTEQRLF
jgi:multiple sugar transport system ATP-binding protein